MQKMIALQWHLSEACNLRCKHCYQEDHKPMQLPYEDLLNILNQYRELLRKTKAIGHINLTGGEPLVCPHLFKLLEEFQKDRDLYDFGILTNGTLITEEMAEKLASYKPNYIQVSLEGTKKNCEKIRGKGTYKKIGEAIKRIKKYDVWVSVSFTATKQNYKELPKVVDYVEKMGGDAVWSDRYIPLGDQRDEAFLMTPEETKEWLEIMKEKRLKQQKEKKHVNVYMGRALQFMYSDELVYQCAAGDRLLTVMENGDLVPCRRMPIYVGNLLRENMYELYTTHPILLDLQERPIPSGCSKCEHKDLCRGGLKCLTYALTKSYRIKDVGCPKE